MCILLILIIHGLYSYKFTFLCFFCNLLILLLKWPTNIVLKCYLSSVPTKKDVMCHMEKIYVLYKLHSVMSYSAVGYELNVMDQQYILNVVVFTQIHT